MIRVPTRFASESAAKMSAAFTLVEVVIAIGLVAFVLTAILGLVAIAANETKNADLKGRLAWITEQVTSEYQSQRFSSVLATVPTNGPLTNGPGVFYWDYSGMRTNSTGAYFVCSVRNVTPTNGTYTTNMALLQVNTRWPYFPSSTNFASTNVSVISLFNYD